MQRALAGMFPRAVLNTLERSSWGLQYARQLSASSTYLQGHDSPSSITTSDPFQGRLQQRTEEQLARMVDEGPSNRTQSSETQVEGNEEQKSKHPARSDEIGGPVGKEPTRYGDWERRGRCSDF